MKKAFTRSFQKDYSRLPKPVQAALEKQLCLLESNPDHPSLRRKKLKGQPDIWWCRVTLGYRFTYQIIGDTCVFRRVGPHSIDRNP